MDIVIFDRTKIRFLNDLYSKLKYSILMPILNGECHNNIGDSIKKCI